MLIVRGYPIETGLEDASLIPFFDPIIEKIGDVAANVLQYFGVKEESSYQITAMAMMLCPLKGGIKGGKTPKIHGNSLSSPRPTWGYKLYDKNSGEFLKNGISSKANPERRYTKTFMKDKEMKPVGPFPNRREAYDWEFEQNTLKRGPLNKNMHKFCNGMQYVCLFIVH